MTKYVLSLDNEIQGYLDGEDTARRMISDLADILVERIRSQSEPSQRIFRENTPDGIKIYTQSIGTVFNGPVFCQHTLNWFKLNEFHLPK